MSPPQVLSQVENGNSLSAEGQSFFGPTKVQLLKNIVEGRSRLKKALKNKASALRHDPEFEDRIEKALSLPDTADERMINLRFSIALRHTGNPDDAEFALNFDSDGLIAPKPGEKEPGLTYYSSLGSAPGGLKFATKEVDGVTHLVPLPSKRQIDASEYTDLQRQNFVQVRSEITRRQGNLSILPDDELQSLRELVIREVVTVDESKYPGTYHLILAQGLRALGDPQSVRRARDIEAWYSPDRPTSYAGAASGKRQVSRGVDKNVEKVKPEANPVSVSLQEIPADPALSNEDIAARRKAWPQQTWNLPSWVRFNPNVLFTTNEKSRRDQRRRAVEPSLPFCPDEAERQEWADWINKKRGMPKVTRPKRRVPAPASDRLPLADSNEQSTSGKVAGGQEPSTAAAASANASQKVIPPPPPRQDDARKGQKKSSPKGAAKRSAVTGGPQPAKAPRPSSLFLNEQRREEAMKKIEPASDPGRTPVNEATGRFVGYGLDGLRYKGRFPTDRFHLARYGQAGEELALGCSARWISLQRRRAALPQARVYQLSAPATHPFSPVCHHPGGFQVCSLQVHSLLQGLTVHMLRFQSYQDRSRRAFFDKLEREVLETEEPDDLIVILRKGMPFDKFPADYSVAAFWRTGKVCEAAVDMYYSLLLSCRGDAKVYKQHRDLLERLQRDPRCSLRLSLTDAVDQQVRRFLGPDVLMGGDIWGLALMEAVRRLKNGREPTGPDVFLR